MHFLANRISLEYIWMKKKKVKQKATTGEIQAKYLWHRCRGTKLLVEFSLVVQHCFIFAFFDLLILLTNDGSLLQLLFVRLCLEEISMGSFHRKAHRVIKYLKLKQMNPSIEHRELMLAWIKFRIKALLREHV